jgi:HEAT repeat protein
MTRDTGFLDRLRAAWERVSPPGRDPAPDPAASRDPRDIPWTVPLVLDRRPEVASVAAASIHAMFAGLAPHDLLAIDESLRGRNHWLYATAERGRVDLAPANVPRLAAAGAPVVGAASFHPNGHVREAAVRALAGLGGGDELPYLLIRLHDWVEPVREAAAGAVRARLVPRYAAQFTRSLLLLERLRARVRVDHGGLLGGVRELVAGPAGRAALRDELGAEDFRVRRIRYRLLLDLPANDAPEIIARALRDGDATIRLRGIEAAGAVLGPAVPISLLEAAGRDPSMPVRLAALGLRVRHFPPAEAELRDALADPRAPLREVARYELRRLGVTGFAAIYRSLLGGAAGARLRGALYGLAETGSAADAAAVERFLSHPAPGTRAAAVAALARLDPAAPAEVFLRALTDAGPRVSRAAMRTLTARPASVGSPKLWELVEHGAHPHVRANALTLLARTGKWESIGWMIRASGMPDERVARRAEQEVRRWIGRFNRDGSRPTRDQIDRMARAVDGAALDEERERMLRFLMKGY